MSAGFISPSNSSNSSLLGSGAGNDEPPVGELGGSRRGRAMCSPKEEHLSACVANLHPVCSGERGTVRVPRLEEAPM